MKTSEANKIIAEFMGTDVTCFYKINRGFGIPIMCSYSESIDALAPIWEKLGVSMVKQEKTSMNQFQERKWKVRLYIGSNTKERGIALVLQEAAAIATARAILNIEKLKEGE